MHWYYFIPGLALIAVTLTLGLCRVAGESDLQMERIMSKERKGR